MSRYFKNLVRLWRRSPLFVIAHVRRKASKSAKKILPVEDWTHWLGEEMRPFNSISHNAGLNNNGSVVSPSEKS
jgi:hypothetical protein